MSTPVKSPKSGSRPIIRPTLGTKICLLVALVFCVAAVYFYWTPLAAATSNGPKFDCQTAFRPPSEDFNKNACANLNEIYQFRAAVSLGAGLLIGLLGALFFGFTKSERAPKPAAPIAKAPAAKVPVVPPSAKKKP